MKNKYALITGASSGIGLEIARVLASRDYSLVLVARQEEKLKKVAKSLTFEYGIKADYFSGDLQNPVTPNNIYDNCQRKGYSISLLVNNAGYEIGRAHVRTPVTS